MPLNPGSRLGPYEIVAPLGAGGMGEVYRARDTRLEREVAIKVLPAEISGRDDLRQRFEREARAISSLHHPHICALHDVGEHDGIRYLVMELLRGEPLDKRIERGPIPTAEALRIAIQIGGALDQAHRQGLIHRDLKPANVMLTESGAKLLDFGLAKAAEPRNAPVGLSAAATRTHLTTEGSIVGTLGYMAPEQLEGKDTDARTDIFAFGVLLYEMLTGTRAFAGESQASLISAIMSADPISPAALQPVASPALERTLRQCLAKCPDQRWHCMHDLVSELKWIAEGGATSGLPGSTVRPQFATWRYAVAGAVAIALISAAALYLRLSDKAPPSRVVSLDFVLPEKLHMRSVDIPTPSPDGERIVFSAMNAENKYTLWIRSLNSPALRQLPETAGAVLPFWSPDGRQIGFLADGKLKRVDLAGGLPQIIVEVTNNFGGATWSSNGTILYGNNGTFYAVPAQGGERKVVRALGEGEYTQYWPQFLADGEHFLYAFQSSSQGDNGFYIGSLDGKLRRKLLGPDTKAIAVDGYLVFSRGDVLYAQEFDSKRLELRGQPTTISDHALTFGSATYGANFYPSLSRGPNNVLAYRTGSTGTDVELTWFDRSGNRISTLAPPAQFSNPALSPDGKWMATGRKDAQGGRDLWLFDLGRGTNTRLTFDPADEFNPTWSPDGKQIAFTGNSRGHRDIFLMDAHGTRAPELLLESQEQKNVEQWSPDGKYLVYNVNPTPGTPQDLYVLPLFGDRKPIAMLTSPFIEDMGQISPDGKWLAYRSNESGTSEVYVLAFAPNDPAARRKWRISTDGGMEPQWRADGKELFYLNSSTLMSVEVKGDGREFEAGLPKVLFDTILTPAITRNRYTASRDGQRFLMVTMTKDQVHPEIHVLVNWEAGLRR
jgi:serine/threonine protein kinase